MKRTFICLLGVVRSSPPAAAAARRGRPPKSRVSGTGSVSLPPDVATVNAAVETNARNRRRRDLAKQRDLRSHRRRAREARHRAQRHHACVLQRELQSAAARSCRRIRRANATATRSRAASRSRCARSATPGRVSDACIGAGATSINGVTFGLADPRAARAQATAKAVAEARANAEALARAAGLRIVAIKSIELAGGRAPGPVPMMRAPRANAPTQFDQSNVNVTVSVSVVFLAEP